ncbi:hypothetical protein BY996DRAFT_6421199 [Phakopsora pachyrhizi]|nr:hypothetical protein BY996DRAFT_6421199 [Phakopsora pachyrhizi]
MILIHCHLLFWESRSVPWLPILPLKIFLWLDSVKPAVEIEEAAAGSVRVRLGGHSVSTEALKQINGDNKGVEEEEEGVQRAEGDNSDGISRAIKKSSKEWVDEQPGNFCSN